MAQKSQSVKRAARRKAKAASVTPAPPSPASGPRAAPPATPTPCIGRVSQATGTQVGTPPASTGPSPSAAVSMQVDEPAPPRGLAPPRTSGALPPFEIPPNYGPVSRAFLTAHPIHEALEPRFVGDTGSLAQWNAAGRAAGIAQAFLGDFLDEYRVQVELSGWP